MGAAANDAMVTPPPRTVRVLRLGAGGFFGGNEGSSGSLVTRSPLGGSSVRLRSDIFAGTGFLGFAAKKMPPGWFAGGSELDSWTGNTLTQF